MEHTIRVRAKPAALIIVLGLCVMCSIVLQINNVKEKFTSLVERNPLYNNLHLHIKIGRRRLRSNLMEHTRQMSLGHPCGLYDSNTLGPTIVSASTHINNFRENFTKFLK